MPQRVVQCLKGDTSSQPTAVRTLPADLLRGAARRLGIMSLVVGALWFVGSILWHISMRAMHGQWVFPLVSDIFPAIGALSSAGLYAYTRRSRADPGRVLDLGLVYMVVTSLLIALMMHWDPMAGRSVAPTVSWLGVVVLVFAAIVPSTPAKTAIASVLAVAMNPLGMLLALAMGTWDFGHPGFALLMHYPDFLLAGVAAIISHVVAGLGQQVAKAREMGSYQLGELIGRGGMGEVYRATHRMLARPAAIKLIRPESLSGMSGESAEVAVRRFKREAEAAANLQSPHTVSLYDFGVTDDQTLYFVMELLDGFDLETLIKRFGPVPPARAVHILRQICASLEEAHVAGLVHRDIKPANIHIGQFGLAPDFVKVLDFGLVKSITGAGSDTIETLGTAMGLTPGTPAYMAPEAALGHPVDGRADLYAVGCVAYFLLTGKKVFEGDSAIQVIAKHVQQTPTPPSAAVETAVPPALDALVLSCLAKSPSDRPQRARDIRQALGRLGIEPWTDEQATEWWHSHRP
jgi:eukaryotic-like serine/threonine-protein kinase